MRFASLTAETQAKFTIETELEGHPTFRSWAYMRFRSMVEQ